MAKSRFRIIALRPITPKDVTDEELDIVKSIQKKVYGSSWLYFYRGYKLQDNDVLNGKSGPETFYGYQLKVSKNVFDDSILYDQEDVCISIGAIVGPNGCGKSSMIELIIRILNNLSVAAKGETINHLAAEHLFFIENVYGCIVLQEDDKYIQIKVAGRSVSVANYQWDERKNVYICGSPSELLSEDARINKFKPIEGSGMMHLYNMFYTAIFNYSIYSFNYKDYYNERTKEDRWHTFKENDRREQYFEGEFNENQVWLKGLFHKNDGYQTPIVLNPMRNNGIIDVPKENHLTNERLLNNLFFKNDKLGNSAESPIFPFRLINDHLEIVALKITDKDNPKFSKENLFTSLRFRDNALTRNFEKIRKEMCMLWSKAYCMAYSEKTPHEKLAWDYVIYKTLKIATTYNKYGNIRRDLIYFKHFDANSVYRHFCNMLQDESHVTLKLRQVLTFLKYKIFRENYSSIIPLNKAYSHFMKVQDDFKRMNWRIDEKSGNIVANLPKEYTLENIPKIEFKDGDLIINIPDSETVYPMPLFFLDKEGSLIVRIPDYEEAIIPPIFDIEPMLIEKTLINKDGSFDMKELMPMSGLSSGEKQIAGSISNMVYHLANINSVWQDKNLIKLTQYKQLQKVGNNQEKALLKYKYVNIVFDEVELYFHPDLQRRFVKNILDALKNLHLEYIEGINIMLVTHSPFVLSDLPRTNVLALNNQQSDIEETFCANIHEMLGSSFFMTYSMGDVAREQIEMAFDIYSRFKRGEKNIIEEKEWKKYQYIASKVADEYLGKLVKGMLEEMQPLIDPEKELNRQIEEAENKLKELMAKKETRK